MNLKKFLKTTQTHYKICYNNLKEVIQLDKMVLKISGLIAIIVGIGWSFTIIGLIVGIPLILGGSTVMNYATMTDKEIIANRSSLLGWSIFFLFFTVIAGVLGLMYYLFSDGKNYFRNFDYTDELIKLDELRKNGIITDKEYEAKKKKILDI